MRGFKYHTSKAFANHLRRTTLNSNQSNSEPIKPIEIKNIGFFGWIFIIVGGSGLAYFVISNPLVAVIIFALIVGMML